MGWTILSPWDLVWEGRLNLNGLTERAGAAVATHMDYVADGLARGSSASVGHSADTAATEPRMSPASASSPAPAAERQSPRQRCSLSDRSELPEGSCDGAGPWRAGSAGPPAPVMPTSSAT